ncbi:Conserved_hypothetical protein [Hexamita inflata]|uniref:Uncharacterized protein n=1 Tax=Hexamita inflata TaxID=28002 RepID=A0AA86RIF1_9EUKA|nr:Conserved hypothetical protein [Hexamita inflata]
MQNIDSYAGQVIMCVNTLLRKLKITTQLCQLVQITPEIVKAFAEYYFDHKVDPLISHLEKTLQCPLRHLNTSAFNRGDIFNCLALCEIVYNLIAQKIQLPPFPVFNDEVVEYLKEKKNTMQAQAAWLSEHGQRNPAGVLVASNLTDQYMNRVQQNNTEIINIDLNSLFDQYLKPIMDKYYRPYQSEREIKYTEHRMRRKLEDTVSLASKQREIDSNRFSIQLRNLVNEQLQQAVVIERRNLVDEAKWRTDEKRYLRSQNKNLNEALMLRKKNENDLQKEEYERNMRLMQDIRREELVYVKNNRRQDEKKAIEGIRNMILQTKTGMVEPGVFKEEIGAQVNQRLRVYAGAEREIMENTRGDQAYKQRILGLGKNLEEGLIDK